MFGWFKKKRMQEDSLEAAIDAAIVGAVSVGAERSQTFRTLGTIDIEVDQEIDNQDLCIKAVVSIIKNLADAAGRSPILFSDDNRFVAGIFACAIANALSFRLSVNFEMTAKMSIFMLISSGERETMEKDIQDVDEITSSYNRIGKDGRIIDAIGMTFSNWFAYPTKENYTRLIELYRLLGNHVQKRDGD